MKTFETFGGLLHKFAILVVVLSQMIAPKKNSRIAFTNQIANI